jgi:nucleoside-diphosphate-sugar epimerase
MDSNKIILITGASGFIGTHLANKAYNLGYKLIGVDLKLPIQPNIWLKFFNNILRKY